MKDVNVKYLKKIKIENGKYWKKKDDGEMRLPWTSTWRSAVSG